MQGREHELRHLGGRDRGADGVRVAHLTQQNHVGALAHRGTQRLRVGGNIGWDLALRDDALAVTVHVLDGVFHRDDMVVTGLVHMVEDAGERGGLTAACGAGHQHHAALEVAQVQHLLGDVHLLGARQAKRNHAHHGAKGSALAEDVRPESAHAGHGKAKVVVVVVVATEDRHVAAGDLVDRGDVALGVGRHERLAVRAHMDAALLIRERQARDDKDIGRVNVDHLLK